MSDQPVNLLSRVASDQIAAAMKNFPDAKFASVEVMEGNAVTVDGHKVVVAFRRTVIKHPRMTYHLWSIESARFAEQ